MPHTIALILAGGTGIRFGSVRPKQFTLVAGRTVLEHSIAAFEQSEEIDEIGIVAHPDHLDEVREILSRQPHPKVTQVVAGGKERQDSTLNGLRAFLREDGTLKSQTNGGEKDAISSQNSAVCAPADRPSEKSPQATEKSPQLSAENGELFAETPLVFPNNAEVRILIHDAVRPALSVSLIDRVCAALCSHAVVNVVLPVVDTLIEVDTDGLMHRVPDRALLRRVQTPQGFHAPVLFEAYRRALSDPDFRATDDCSVVFRYCPEIDIALVPGEERNLKLTYPEDLTVLAHYLTQPLP